MIFTQEQIRAIDHSFNTTRLKLGYSDISLVQALEACAQNEKNCMKYVYSCMPISDWYNVEFDVLLDYVKHSLFLYEQVAWCKTMPSDIFLDYVLFPRINNEKIEACRHIFYKQLEERIHNKSMEETVIDINYWCLEKVTYKSTDERTSSPLTLLKTANGRCGEESTFTVTALRSVGIPARQVYVPRWSHCDDNHAWVEAWIDGRWCYLGACEPEKTLDSGWFKAASARAMMIHSRLFMLNNRVEMVNQLHRYAQVKELSITVADEYGQPIQDAKVEVEVLNYSEYFPISVLRTNHLGRSQILTGYGDVHLLAHKDNVYIGEMRVMMHEENVTLIKNNRQGYFDVINRINFRPPVDVLQAYIQVSQEEKRTRAWKFNQSDKRRKAKEQGFYEEATRFLEAQNISEPKIVKGFMESGDNIDALKIFVMNEDFAMEDKKMLLNHLCLKDYKDITATMLIHHLSHALAYKGGQDREIYGSYLLNPRVYYEELSAYRDFILDYFSEKQQADFQAQPEKVYVYIRAYVKLLEDEDEGALFTNPMAVLTYGVASRLSQKITCVCICRTLGIPAKLDPITHEVHYCSAGNFVSMHSQKDIAELVLVNSDNHRWEYFQNYTIARQEYGKYVTLHYQELTWSQETYVHQLHPGKYRIMTSNRMPNGSIWLNEHYVEIPVNTSKSVSISLEDGDIQDMLKNITVPNFYVSDGEVTYKATEVLGDEPMVVIWLEEGREPTEHILNELQAKAREYQENNVPITFLLNNSQALNNKTLEKTLQVLPHIKVYYVYEESDVEEIARRIFVEPNKYPLTIVIENGLKVIYGFSGYNVGLSSLIMKIFNR